MNEHLAKAQRLVEDAPGSDGFYAVDLRQDAAIQFARGGFP